MRPSLLFAVLATALVLPGCPGLGSGSVSKELSSAQFADIPVPRGFALDDAEGQWVIEGGVDTSTGLEAVTTMIAPAGFDVVTPLTTLVTTLAEDSGMTSAEAAAQVLQAMGLPQVELGNFDPIAEAVAGNVDGASSQIVLMLTSFCYMPAVGIAMAGKGATVSSATDRASPSGSRPSSRSRAARTSRLSR